MDSKILVPLDGSHLAEQVLPYVRLLAGAFEAPVELLRVSDPEARPSFRPAAVDYLKETGARLLPSTRVECVEKSGGPAQIVVDEAQGAGLIAMATHGTSGLRRWLLGSVASKVVQTATTPLLLIRPVESADPSLPVKLKTVFVPLDGSNLAEKVLPHVIALARKLQLEVHLLRVYTLPVNAYVTADGVITQGPAEFREPLQKEAQTYLDAKRLELQDAGLACVIATAIEGDPASEIIDLALNTADNLVAMSTHGRSGAGRWMLGSVAERVVQHCRDPVLLIRPV